VTPGAWGGAARTKLWPIIQSRPSLVGFPEGETIRAMQGRAVEAVEQLAARHRRQVVAAVSHGDVIKAIIGFYVGQPLDLFQRLHVAPASVSALRLGDGPPVLLRLGDDGPLRLERP
jgi:broad specificity phosphatase PhoE